MKAIKVRYGPSPTGIPHIGNIRTALFNFLFAKSQKGEFLLRIEDTDQARIVKDAVEKIKESLKILNLNWDGDIIFQSKRLDIYQKYLKELKSKGLAYEDEGAWRFKTKTDKKTIGWKDAVHGPVEFPSNVVEDFIIIKSDGFPTYHFASVVDDHELEISHVMRGDEWISSTPKHILLYKALGWEHPEFVHLPPILGEDHKKLSKREGAKSVIEYVDDGYLPEAIVNFLALLGWAPKGDREIFSLSDLIEEFTLDRINKNSPVFNVEKLDWFDKEWIKKISDGELESRLENFTKGYSAEIIKKTVPIVKDRLTRLSDYQNLCQFFAQAPEKYDESIKGQNNILEITTKNLEQINWHEVEISEVIKKTADETKSKIGEVAMVLRIAISGQRVTPPLNESMIILGKEETLKRLNNAAKKQK